MLGSAFALSPCSHLSFSPLTRSKRQGDLGSQPNQLICAGTAILGSDPVSGEQRLVAANGAEWTSDAIVFSFRDCSLVIVATEVANRLPPPSRQISFRRLHRSRVNSREQPPMWRNGRRNGLKIRLSENSVWVRVPPSAPSKMRISTEAAGRAIGNLRMAVP